MSVNLKKPLKKDILPVPGFSFLTFNAKVKEKSKNTMVILAGYPKDQIEKHKKSGVDDFIFLGADAHSIISNLLKRIGAM